MNRIYFRGGMSPLDALSPGRVLNSNVIGTNVGNFLYLHGVLRALTTEGSVLEANYYDVNKLKPEEVNERFDCFMIPLADGFRESFEPELKKLTKFVEKLNIPCVVAGVGVRAPLGADFSEGLPCDDTVRKFVKAVLKKSSCIGVRGELTGKYLEHLGFKEDADYMVIGCPSMYSFGSKIELKEPNFAPGAKICFNSNSNSPEIVKQYIQKAIDECDNPYFVGQVVEELRCIYMGAPYGRKKTYPFHQVTDPLYKEGRLRFFMNVPTWLEFMKGADFAFGSRLHGNISAIIAGTPSILVVKDTRTRELSDYHHLNCVDVQELKDMPTLETLTQKQDFGQIARYQKQNFERFVSFLDKNGLDHIYKDGQEPEISPLEKMMEKVAHVPGVVPLSMCTTEEIAERNRDYFEQLDKKIKRMGQQQRELADFMRNGSRMDKVKKIVKLMRDNELI